MKKFFTLLSAAMLCSSAAMAESVIVEVYDFDNPFGDPIAESFNAEVTSANGVYTLANIFNSGIDVSFTVEEYGDVYFEGDCEFEFANGETHILYGKDGKYPAPWTVNFTKGGATELVAPYFVEGEGQSMCNIWDGECALELVAGGKDADGNQYNLLLTTTFKASEDTTSEPVEEGDKVYIYSTNYDDDIVMARTPFTFEQNADGTYTVKNFLNSGAPLNFSFEVTEGAERFPITFLDNVRNVDAHFTELLNAEGEVASGSYFDIEESQNPLEGETYDIYNIGLDPANAYVFINDEDNDGEGKYRAQIYVYAKYTDDNNPCNLCLYFSFDATSNASGEDNFEAVAYVIDPEDGAELSEVGYWMIEFDDEEYVSVSVNEDTDEPIKLVCPDNAMWGTIVIRDFETNPEYPIVFLNVPNGMTQYTVGEYTLSIPAGALVVTDKAGVKHKVQGNEFTYTVVAGEPVDFKDFIVESFPENNTLNLADYASEDDDEMGYVDGLENIGWVVDGEFSVNYDSLEQAVMAKDGETIGTAGCWNVFAENGIEWGVGDDLDPTFGVGSFAYVGIYFDVEEQILEVGNYELTFPAGLLTRYNSPVNGFKIEYSIINETVGIERVMNASDFTVVDINGRVVLRNASASAVNELARGLYIINGKKVIKK